MNSVRSVLWLVAALTFSVLCGLASTLPAIAQPGARPAPPSTRAPQNERRRHPLREHLRGPALRGAKYTARFVADVMRAGRPGTMVPGFTGAFTTTQIQRVSAYVASLQPTAATTAARPQGLHGDAAAGERLFFNESAAHSYFRCHAFRGRGGRIGSELSLRVAGLSSRELFERIVVVPHRRTDPQYVMSQLRTRGGLLLHGIRAGENRGDVLFCDTSTLPPVLRVVRKAEVVEERRRAGTPIMPTDYAARFSLQELLDLVAFLQSPGTEFVPLGALLQ